jgi:pimeloyl-ACP methyl ester carboxylesterase
MIIEKYLTINNVPVRVCIAGNAGQAILFVHGNSCSADYWEDQLNDPTLQGQYQLIAFDLPGHGKSGKVISYGVKNIASFIPQVIDQLSLQDYILVGLSFGTALIAEAAPAVSKTPSQNGCRGFFLASPNITSDLYPPASYILPFPEVYAMATDVVPDEVLTEFAGHLVRDAASPLIEQFKQSYLQTDPPFRLALQAAMLQNEWSDEFANLADTHLPYRIIFGKEEKILNIHYLDNSPLPANASIDTIDGAAHFVNMEQVAIFNGLLAAFAGEAFK